jgi:hypothetical protein
MADKRLTVEEAWEQGASIPVTRDYYEKHTLFSKKTYKQGKKAIITRPHRGFLDQITQVDVRLNDGERVREVPVDFFSV